MDRESMEYDVVIVGAGPAGLSAAIRLAQLARDAKQPIKICVLEKGSRVGAHILSGAVLEPRALNELLPEWQTQGAPLNTPATKDEFLLLTKRSKISLPVPPQMRNQGNFIISLSQFCRWLAIQAETLGVEIFPGFAATEMIYDKHNRVQGVITGEMGLNKLGEKKANFQPGMALLGRYILLAEGCRGSLTKYLSERFQLQANRDPQTFGLGIKEIWEIEASKHQRGTVTHTVGWPLDKETYGGSFLYHFEANQLAIGLVVGLDYKNPYLDPFEEFQRFKHHPTISPLLEGGRCIAYGARALNEGGFQSIPKLAFPGGLLLGCAAGFLNVPKIKGTHTAMKSGMLAAEAVFAALLNNGPDELSAYEAAIKNSWVGEELYLARNIRPAFQKGLWAGLAYSALDTYLLQGKAPWTFHNHADYLSLKKASECRAIDYPKPDGIISFDKLTSLQLSNLYYKEDQPVHLKLKNPTIPITYNLPLYDAPEQRYCPAQVYEIVLNNAQKPYLQINAQNCVQCKTCDIKDPSQNIDWVPPEGGDGPNYSNM